jgi:hypothetical protein
MINVFRCASCGHTMKVPEEQLGRKLKCQMCNATFRATPDTALNRYDKSGKGAKAAKQTAKKPSLWARLTKKTSSTAIMLDGAIGGAIGGIIVGIMVGSIAGATTEQFGGVINGIFVGLITGFGLGVLIGIILGLFSKTINYLLQLNANQASVVSGVLTGAAIAPVLGNPRYALIGAVLGGIGAGLWALLHGWADSYMPPAPSNVVDRSKLEWGDEDDDDRPTRRHTIDPGTGDYPKGGGWPRRSKSY